MGIAAARPVAVETPLGGDELLLVRMNGTEQLGRLFQLDLELFSKNANIAAEDVLGGNMTVRLELQGGGTRFWNGLVSRFSTAGSNEEFYRYEVTLRPWLWFLTRTSDCRIFQEKSVPEILEQVFGDAGFSDYRLELSESYEPWTYCVQYRETDFNFLSRLMEHEGIYYFVEHENGKHTIVFSDAYSAHQEFEEYETIPFFLPGEKDLEERDCINEWRVTKRVQSGSVVINAFDFEQPKTGLLSSTASPQGHDLAEFEVFDYQGGYVAAGVGETYTRIRHEELHARYEEARGVGNARGIAPGYLFTLEGYPQEEANQEYLVVAASYRVRSDEFRGSESPEAEEDLFGVNFTCIVGQTPYRTPRITPKPRIQGVQTAVVVGASGEEIWTDEHGRVKVKFHWDRESVADENSSCWIRVAQHWAGKGWGYMHIPRIGHEVIIEFEEGDPDRPLVTGRIYNGDNSPPWTLPDNQTQSGLKTNSSKGGGGFNCIRFEDKKGEEQILFQAEKNQDVRVKACRHESIGANRHLTVEKKKFELIKEDREEHVEGSHKETIDTDRSLAVGGGQKVDIGKKFSLTIGEDAGVDVTGDTSIQSSGQITLKAAEIVLEADSNITLKVGVSTLVLEPTEVETKSANVKIAADVGFDIKGGLGGTVDGGLSLTLKGGMVKIN